MILLSVDTSGTQGSLALAHVEDGLLKKSSQVFWTKKAMHSEVATVELQNLLTTTKTELHDLTHLTVNVGPGSFTGIRVGISLVKTLAYSLALPVCSFNTLELLAFKNAKPGDKIFVATKAVQNFYYAASFLRTATGVQNLIPPEPHEFEHLADLSQDCTKVLIEGSTLKFAAATEALDLVQLMAGSGFSLTFSDWKVVEPLYLRASEAEEKLKKGLLKPV
jgi:tRNA threonylcarbamoyl adenosine modification protein YeaZ